MAVADLASGDLRGHAEALATLALKPPQTLLLEGGSEEGRLALALYWAMCANCANGQNGVPCLVCPVCRQTETLDYLDLRVFDGRISNKADEEKPDKIRALNMENIRGLKRTLGVEPRGKKHVVIIQGLVQAREEAANSLLKTLEDPVENALFVLLAPQRSQLLPTLVSRSHCMALPWTDSSAQSPALREWEGELAEFLGSGRGLLAKLAGKGAVDAQLATELILSCQRALALGLGATPGSSPMQGFFSHIAASPAAALQAGNWLGEAQDLALANVNPARILEALFTRLYLLGKNPANAFTRQPQLNFSPQPFQSHRHSSDS